MEEKYYNKWQGKRAFVKGQPREEEAKQFVNKQAYWQQFNAPHRRVFMPIIAPDWSWQSDSMFFALHGKLRAIFCAVEMTRRLGFVRVYSGASPTAGQCKEFLEELKAKYEVRFIGADKGSEYENSTVKSWASSNGVELRYYEKGALRSKGLVERFNATVRRILNWWTFNHSKSWVTTLPKLIDEDYNGREHSSIGMAPSAVTDSDAARIREEAYARGSEYRKKLDAFVPGARVRLYWKVDPEIPDSQKAFRKLGSRWSKTVYEVEAVKGYKVKVQGLAKTFSVSDLQLVSEPEGSEVAGGISEVARLKKGKREAELAEIDAVIPGRELAAIIPEGRQLKEKPAEIVPMELRPKKREVPKEKPELNEELAPVQKGDDLAVKVLGYEFRKGKKGAGAKWGLWFHVKYQSGAELWERVQKYLVPAYEILGNRRKKQVGWNVLAPVGAFWDKQRKKDAELERIWATEL